MKKKVFVGLSGGVDSAVSAYLLLEQGYDVTGVYMKNWSGEDYGVADQCPWKEDLESAKSVAEHLGIPFIVYNFEKEYERDVINDFFLQYSLGNTPNPDVLCNKYIKFNAFLNRAISQGADFIATGHYCVTKNGELFRGVDRNKDQSYFLHQLTPEQLSKSLFPVGELPKSEVRRLAEIAKLPNSKRKDSQGICFLGEINVRDFLKNRIKESKGEIIDIDNNIVVGHHVGVWFYTIGQRHGLGVGGSKVPYFIVKKDVEKNIIYVAKGNDNHHLSKKMIKLDRLNIISEPNFKHEITAQIRYRGEMYKVTELKITDKKAEVIFNDSVWAPSLGQSVVFFQDEKCLGGGEISKIVD